MFLFDDLPLSWTPYGWPERSPIFCDNPIGHDKVPMIFWGSFYGPGAAKKKGRLLRCEILSVSSLRNHLILIFLCGLDPDGCLVADRLRIRTKTVWKLGRRQQIGSYPCWTLSQQKKWPFLRWKSIFYWQVPFNGYQYLTHWNQANIYVFLLDIPGVVSLQYLGIIKFWQLSHNCFWK